LVALEIKNEVFCMLGNSGTAATPEDDAQVAFSVDPFLKDALVIL
jgi:hypothetical protein